ncbi:MAG: four helix bundle protein [Candidatus Omnitrophica bacterium]|nr:four helix bundle protein [Candidatus Omnitrophota bacterium]
MSIDKKFPLEERYSLIDQLRRSSRSVPINIREGFAKKKYKQVFVRHLIDSLGSSEETRGWLSFACDFNYIDQCELMSIDEQYDQLNAMLYSLIENWE